MDNLDVKILTHLLEDSRKSFQEIAKQCLTSVPTVKSRVDRLVELGVIRKFTLGIDAGRLGIPEAILINIRILPVKDAFRKTSISLASQNITITCAYCDKKVTEGAVRKKLGEREYFFCCSTCLGAFEQKFRKVAAKV